jgi:hypothetical protein
VAGEPAKGNDMKHIKNWLRRGDWFRVVIAFNENDDYYHATLERQELSGQWYESVDGFGPNVKAALESLDEQLEALPDRG